MNKVILIGNLGKDVDLRTTANGETQIGRFTLATNKKVKGEDVTQWHNCTAFNKTAELIAQYCGKGTKLAVVGEIEYRKDGDRWYTNIIVREFDFVDSKPTTTPYRDTGNASGPEDNISRGVAGGACIGDPSRDDFDDDIPF